MPWKSLVETSENSKHLKVKHHYNFFTLEIVFDVICKYEVDGYKWFLQWGYLGDYLHQLGDEESMNSKEACQSAIKYIREYLSKMQRSLDDAENEFYTILKPGFLKKG